jgi:hypothetical protein
MDQTSTKEKLVKRFSRRSRRTAATRAAGRARPQFGVALAAGLLASLAFSVTAFADTVTTGSDLPNQVPYGYKAPANDGLGVAPGQIKHVWVIVLENKAYNASFTPLEGTQGQYLSQLPAQGALLTNYYGTGHSSLDNYVSMVSGQAPVTDTQNDCPSYLAMNGNYDDTPGTANYGQFVSSAGANAPSGDNGCVYPSSVPTLFNQLDKTHRTWKLYAQDLGNSDINPSTNTSYDAGTPNNPINQNSIADCAGAAATVGPAPSATQTSNPDAKATSPYYVNGSANPSDQYVAKHNPVAWFDSLLPASEGGTGGNTCAEHLAPIFGQNDQLYTDLQHASSTPDFSYIVPNNCNNGHDSVCAGNNLSGLASNSTTASSVPAPVNYTGGTYAESKFLSIVVPEIEKSPAFQDHGLIVVTYDESYPPFTWQNSFANSTLLPSTAYGSLITDQAGETLYGRSVNWEPTGPNLPVVSSATGQVLDSGPGGGASLDRPTLAQAGTNGPLVGCSNGTAGANGYLSSPACLSDLAGSTQGTVTTPSVTINGGSSNVSYVVASSASTPTLKNEGQQVTFNGTVSLSDGGNPYSGPVYVGNVMDTAQNATASSASNPRGAVDTGAFQLVDASGNLVSVTSTYTGTLTLAALSPATDPYYDAYDPTLGGGDAGAVLISPYIKPGTVSNTDYNHYSLLRSLEDIFGVRQDAPGIDGQGHIGYAAQPGLAPFGTDVFSHQYGWDHAPYNRGGQ